jgi:hypothetical protein
MLNLNKMSLKEQSRQNTVQIRPIAEHREAS